MTELSRRSGFSPSFISQVERSLTYPSVGALKRIAEALGVTVSVFFDSQPEGWQAGSPVVRRHERKKLIYPGTNIVNELLTPDLRGQIEFLWLSAPPNTGSGDQWLSHVGQDAAVVMEGCLEVELGSQVYRLEPGDSISFDSTTPHRWRSVGPGELKAVWVTVPPTF